MGCFFSAKIGKRTLCYNLGTLCLGICCENYFTEGIEGLKIIMNLGNGTERARSKFFKQISDINEKLEVK